MNFASDTLIESILDDFDEGVALRSYSNRELVEHFIAFDSDVALEEMMTRLYPDWEQKDRGH